MAITYLLVRHGEAEGNKEHRFIGQSDVPLSPLGIEQADAVCDQLASQRIDGILASDLSRAVDTITPLSSRLGVPIETDENLREIANGEWAGMVPGDIAERWPEVWQRYRSGEDVERPGGERWADVQARAIGAIQDDACTRKDGDVVVVASHGGPTLGLITWAAGLELDRGLFRGPFGPVANASISSIELPEPRVLSYNETGHLGELARQTSSPFERR